MRIFSPFNVLCIALGLGYSFRLDEALNTIDQLIDDTARQNRDDLDTIVPLFGVRCFVC